MLTPIIMVEGVSEYGTNLVCLSHYSFYSVHYKADSIVDTYTVGSCYYSLHVASHAIL